LDTFYAAALNYGGVDTALNAAFGLIRDRKYDMPFSPGSIDYSPADEI